MNITEEDIRRIVREEIEAYFRQQAQGGNVVAEPQGEYNAVRDAEDDLYKRAMAAMDATLGEQENPICLQSHRPNLHVIFERGIHWEIGMGYGE